MLQSIRDNSQGIIAKIIVGLIAVTFALFGVESLISMTSGSSAPATVNGEEITKQELYQASQILRRQKLSQMGNAADPALLNDNLIQSEALNALIERSILLQAADEQKLSFSDAMVDQLILSNPMFQKNGKFVRAQFEAALRNAGMTPLMYRRELKNQQLMAQQQSAFVLSSFTLPTEIKQLAMLEQQKRSIEFFTLPIEVARKDIKSLSDEEVSQYFQQNKSDYMTEEQVDIEYILLNISKLESKVKLEDKEIQSAYQTLVDNFKPVEKRHSAHILVKITAEQDEATAKEKIQSLANRISAGEDFAALAKAESEDSATAASGGDLGNNEKGIFPEEFETALFDLKKSEVSPVIRTDYGFHLIKLLDIETTKAPTFEQAEAGLKARLLQRKAEEEYVVELEKLADISFSAGDLIEPSEALNLEIKKVEAITRTTNNSTDEISSNPRVITAAFDPELIDEGLNSTPIQLDSGRAVVIRVTAHKMPHEKTLEDVKELISQKLITEKAITLLKQQAQARLERLQQGKSISDVAADLEINNLDKLTRDRQDVEPEIIDAVFSMPKPENGSTYSIVDMSDGSKSLVALNAVIEDDTEFSDDEQRFMVSMLNSLKGQQLYQGYFDWLKSHAEIEKM